MASPTFRRFRSSCATVASNRQDSAQGTGGGRGRLVPARHAERTNVPESGYPQALSTLPGSASRAGCPGIRSDPQVPFSPVSPSETCAWPVPWARLRPWRLLILPMLAFGPGMGRAMPSWFEGSRGSWRRPWACALREANSANAMRAIHPWIIPVRRVRRAAIRCARSSGTSHGNGQQRLSLRAKKNNLGVRT